MDNFETKKEQQNSKLKTTLTGNVVVDRLIRKAEKQKK